MDINLEASQADSLHSVFAEMATKRMRVYTYFTCLHNTSRPDQSNILWIELAMRPRFLPSAL